MTDIAPSTPPVVELAPPPPPASPASAVPPPFAVRIWSLFTCLICFGMLGVGLYLTPDPDGFGKTRGLFGMPACGFYHTTGYPCPTCGCTTAVSHFAHGHLLTSFLTQPFGFLVALAALVAGCLALVGVITGRWIGPSMFKLQWYWRVWTYGGLAVLAAAWAYKSIIIKLGHG